ncbi:flavodoxin family protein [Treponema sp.]|uniref:flavodoxin family protein n=1 Tax=Treponema sp. TaxID=166 RepID=UPI00298E3C58|nr:flavodoxin family protein [Treponema sp.]MCR5614489.1 flavodoxin family protein [Treponema sp.]
MKVILINGSPRKSSNTSLGIKEMQKIFTQENIETEVIDIGTKEVRGCIACGKCGQTGKCVFDDAVNEVAQKLESADGMVVGSPVYYSAPNASVQALMQRLFYSSHFDKTMKVGASFVCARRGGTTASFDVLNKFFTISGMPVASSQYWNNIHGGAPGEAQEDKEGMQTLRVLARNMSFLIKSIALGKEKYGLPQKEEHEWTNFI